jgi:hypothetical protein
MSTLLEEQTAEIGQDDDKPLTHYVESPDDDMTFCGRRLSPGGGFTEDAADCVVCVEIARARGMA